LPKLKAGKTVMTKIEQSRKAWQDAYRRYGKGSPEEIAAYREYVKNKQGQGKSKNRSYLTKIKKEK